MSEDTSFADYRMVDLRSVDWSEMGNAGRTPSGVRVTPESALTCSAFLACVRVISESCAALPLHLYEKLDNGGKQRATGQALYRMLKTAPNPTQTAFEFREQMTALYLMFGNSYAEIRPGAQGAVSELWPLHPSRMEVSRIEDGSLRYRYREPSGRQTVYTQDQIFHLRWLTTDGILGMQPSVLCRNAIGLAQALESHGSTYFGNGARPGMILESANPIPMEAADRLRDQFERLHRGADRAFRTCVLPNGVTAKELGGSNEASQFLETRQHQVIEVARAFRVPPHMIQDLSRSTYSNIEVQGTEFVQHCLLPHLKRWEAAISRDLIVDDERYFAEHSVMGLMRGASGERAAYYTQMAGLGVLSINDIRELENLNPIGPEGDQRFMNSNMTTIEKIVAQPAPAPAAGRSIEVRAMTISIDFDQTFSKDPTLWGKFAATSAASGNTVVMITRREDTPENQQTIADALGSYADAFSTVLLIGPDALKADAAKAAGINVDVWIDDSPQTVKG